MSGMTFTRNASKLKVDRILDALGRKPMSKRELSDEVHISLRYVTIYINKLKADKLVYIKRWNIVLNTGHRYPHPVYALGNFPDAKKPERDSRKTIQARAWKKLKDDADRHLGQLNRKRARAATKRIRPDIASAWCFGPTSASSFTTN